MATNTRDGQLVEEYFKAMQAGPDGLEAMVALFTDDAEYTEPFSAGGQPTRHVGRPAIRAFFEASYRSALHHDVRLTLERLDVDGDQLRSEWICVMPAFPGPMRGWDQYTIRAGKIARLEIHLSGPASE